MHNYEASTNTLPYGARACCQGTWLIPVLPFVEQAALYNSWNASGNNSGLPGYVDALFRYSGAVNTKVTTTRVSAYFCASDGNNTQTVAKTMPAITSQNYVANFGNITFEQGVISGGKFTHALTSNGVTYPFLGHPSRTSVLPTPTTALPRTVTPQVSPSPASPTR